MVSCVCLLLNGDLISLYPFKGQKIKLVIASCLWNDPQVNFFLNNPVPGSAQRRQKICVLDEPSSFLLLLSGIGPVPWYAPMSFSPQLFLVQTKVIISHNEEFVNVLSVLRDISALIPAYLYVWPRNLDYF